MAPGSGHNYGPVHGKRVPATSGKSQMRQQTGARRACHKDSGSLHPGDQALTDFLRLEATTKAWGRGNGDGDWGEVVSQSLLTPLLSSWGQERQEREGPSHPVLFLLHSRWGAGILWGEQRSAESTQTFPNALGVKDGPYGFSRGGRDPPYRQEMESEEMGLESSKRN